MVFGRSNSLSLNTGAANSAFASQQNNTNNSSTTNNMNSTQPPAPLFGNNANNNSNTTGGSSLFGGGATNNNNTTGNSLFGGSGGGLASTTTNNNTTGNSLFGGGGGGLGSTTTNNNTTGNSLFGGSGGGLGGSTTNSATNMFSRPNTTTNNTSTSANNNSLFGQSSGQQQPSLLGVAQHNLMSQSQPFVRLGMGQSTTTNPSNSTTNPTTTTVGAAKIDLENLRPTTRFEDCVDQVKQEIEAIDKMIAEQEKYAKQIEAFLPKHGEDIQSLAPDVEYIADKADDVETALAGDAQGVDAARKRAEKGRRDMERCARIVENLALPVGWQYSGMAGSTYGGAVYGRSQASSQQRPSQQSQPANKADKEATGDGYDTDLIGNYFIPLAAEMQKAMDAYAANLSEIESHMRVIENSAVQQAQSLAQRKVGVGGQRSSGDATVRELADTLRGFEESILGVAGVVGECRDGVNELVLGRFSGGQ